MEKVKINSLEGEKTGETDLPSIFEEEIRPDVIKKSVLSSQSSKKQPKGADSRAGMKTTAETPPKGSGQTRVRRIQGRRYHAAGRATWAPFTVGGRRTHPPKAEEKSGEGINKKEKNFALRTAISATKIFDLISSRGHEVDGEENFPIIVEDELEKIKKTHEVKNLLEKLGLWDDVKRVKNGRKIRSGKGKARGRKYKQGAGPLFIVSEDRGIKRAARNIPGVDVALVEQLNVVDLAPGGHPARLTVWSESALEELDRRFSN